MLDLEATRAKAVGSAETERRRIERDLHDGAQARLVALAMELGRAKEKFETDPAAAQALVEHAHEEAKATIGELRNLARGIHPAVLTDRGLDAALSSLAARSPVPVRIDVRAGRRPAPEVESIAYFVVAEALTNVAKHAGATEAEVVVARDGDRLVVEIRDDGVGGAEARANGGIGGLTDRVEAIDGTMTVWSPDGGPTVIRAELPCAS
jgi:signal transduction histidine kinase